MSEQEETSDVLFEYLNQSEGMHEWIRISFEIRLKEQIVVYFELLKLGWADFQL